MKKTEIVVAGHLCLDIHPEFGFDKDQKVETLFRPGRLIEIDGVSVSTGGPVSNTGFALARLGLATQTVGNIGNDEFGSLVAAVAERETGQSPHRSDGVSTSYSIILSPPGIDRIILHDPAGNNEFAASDIDFDDVGKAGYFHFGYPPLMRNIYQNGGAELMRIYKQAKAAGAVTSLDMSLPDVDSDSGKVDWKSIIESVLEYVDVFVPSIEEILFMMDRAEYDRIMAISSGDDFTQHVDFSKVRSMGDTLLKLGSAIVMIKCGANGIYIKTAGPARMQRIGKPEWADAELFQPTYHVEDFKSALGGGDTTVAGFLSGMIRGYSLFDCARLACRTGAQCCTTYNSVDGLLPLEQIYEMISSAKINHTDLPISALKFDETEQMFLR